MAKVIIQLKGDTTANLQEQNLLLFKREPCFEFLEDGTVNLKIGDGQTLYNDLPYALDTAKIKQDIKNTNDSIGRIENSIQGDCLSKTDDLKDNIVTFEEALERTNINSGEKESILLGKIKKWFSSLKALAFKDVVSKSDLSEELLSEISNSLNSEGIQNAIGNHNISTETHQDIRNIISSLSERVVWLENILMNNSASQSFSYSFGELNNIDVEGVWNKASNRIEF